MWTDSTKTESLNDLLLLDYATGVLNEAESLIVATHLALNPQARHVVTEMEAIGGALLEDCAPVEISSKCFDRVLEKIDDVKTEPAQTTARETASCDGIPEPLRSYLNCAMLEQVGWDRMFRQIMRHDINTRTPTRRVRLMRLEPGAETPSHAHDGFELTLVLDGAYEDEYGAFKKGDLSIITDDSAHAPAACPKQGCVCLTVTTAPLHFTSPLGRLVNTFLRF